MPIRHQVTLVLLGAIASACGQMGMRGSSVVLPDSAAEFRPNPLVLGVGQRAPLTLVIDTPVRFAYVDLSPQSGGVTLSNFSCEPAGSCGVPELPDPEYPSGLTSLPLRGAKSITMTVEGVRAGRTSLFTELALHECDDYALNCDSYFANPRVEIDVRP